MLSLADSDFLSDYAVKNIWSNRRLESNVILKCNRFTSNLPRRGIINYRGSSLSLPDDQHEYHVYLLNAIPDRFLNFNSTGLYSWYSLDELNNRDALIIHVYDTLGKVYPSTLCYLRRLANGMLILAVVADSLPNMKLGVEDIRLHFYNNRSRPQIKTIGQVIRNDSDKVAFINTLRQYQGMVGFCTIYRNGQYYLDLENSDLIVGDYVEFTYDSSVKYVNVFDVIALNSFVSSQYETPYYVVMNWNDQNPNVDQTLFYRNDLTLYVTNPNIKDGCMVTRDDRTVVKQLTFQDIAVRVTDIDYYISLIENTTNQTAKMVVITRDDGQGQVWEGDANRVTELYKTGDKAHIESLLLAQTASVVEWTADSLMNSPYIALLESPYDFMDGALVWDGLGAYAAEHVLLQNPHSESPLILSPSTYVKYNVLGFIDGLLNSVSQNIENRYEYLPPDTGETYWEIVQGTTTNAPTSYEHYNERTVTLPTDTWFKCFVGEKDPVTQQIISWREIPLDDPDVAMFYHIDSGVLTWVTEAHMYDTIVRFSRDAYLEYYPSVPKESNLTFTINTVLPFREVRVFANKHPLVEGVDYFVKWPHVTITNKSHLKTEGNNDIHIVALGFPACDCQYYAPTEVGFIDYGMISYNDSFYLRDWRNYRLIVGGKALTLDEVEWTEDNQGAIVGNLVNGLPYQITMPDSYTATRDDMERVVASREKDVDLDNRVRAYLETVADIPTSPTPPTYPVPYKLYSSFMSIVMKALKNGTLTFTFSDIAIHTLDVLLADYLYLLPMDACVNDEHIRWDVVMVEPHEFFVPVSISFDHYQICEAINAYYLNNKVSLAQLLRIGR